MMVNRMMLLSPTIGNELEKNYPKDIKYILNMLFEIIIYLNKFTAIGKTMARHHPTGCGAYFQWLGIKVKSCVEKMILCDTLE